MSFHKNVENIFWSFESAAKIEKHGNNVFLFISLFVILENDKFIIFQNILSSSLAVSKHSGYNFSLMYVRALRVRVSVRICPGHNLYI